VFVICHTNALYVDGLPVQCNRESFDPGSIPIQTGMRPALDHWTAITRRYKRRHIIARHLYGNSSCYKRLAKITNSLRPMEYTLTINDSAQHLMPPEISARAPCAENAAVNSSISAAALYSPYINKAKMDCYCEIPHDIASTAVWQAQHENMSTQLLQT
jgi:hypothetical protein